MQPPAECLFCCWCWCRSKARISRSLIFCNSSRRFALRSPAAAFPKPLCWGGAFAKPVDAAPFPRRGSTCNGTSATVKLYVFHEAAGSKTRRHRPQGRPSTWPQVFPVGAFAHHGRDASLDSQIPENLGHHAFFVVSNLRSRRKTRFCPSMAKLGFGACLSSRLTTVIHVAVTI